MSLYAFHLGQIISTVLGQDDHAGHSTQSFAPIYVLARSRSCVCPDVVIPGRTDGGSARKILNCVHMNLQAFYSGSENAKYTNTSRRNQVSMALFLCANIHQGDELFDVYSRGKQSTSYPGSFFGKDPGSGCSRASSKI